MFTIATTRDVYRDEPLLQSLEVQGVRVPHRDRTGR